MPSQSQATNSAAIFRANQLEQCIDITVSGDPETVEKVMKGFEAMQKQKGQSTLQKPCAQQFAERTVLATCRASIDEADVGMAGMLVAYYYDVTTARDSDVNMKGCFQMNGSWSENSGKAVARERVRQRMHNVQRLLKEQQ